MASRPRIAPEALRLEPRRDEASQRIQGAKGGGPLSARQHQAQHLDLARPVDEPQEDGLERAAAGLEGGPEQVAQPPLAGGEQAGWTGLEQKPLRRGMPWLAGEKGLDPCPDGAGIQGQSVHRQGLRLDRLAAPAQAQKLSKRRPGDAGGVACDFSEGPLHFAGRSARARRRAVGGWFHAVALVDK